MARKLDPISIAMLNYIQAVEQTFGLSASHATVTESNKEGE